MTWYAFIILINHDDYDGRYDGWYDDSTHS